MVKPNRQGNNQSTRPCVFLHGVPDTPHIWQPLLNELGMDIETPALPGFVKPPPHNFDCSKEAYAQWFITYLEYIYSTEGPINVVGHDWGALIVLRAASLRPELFHSWVVSGALIEESYRGHLVAKIWATPIFGEIFMATVPRFMMKRTFIRSGLSNAIAIKEANAWRKHMKLSILKLYRSARGLKIDGSWLTDLKNLPRKGLLIWGSHDPYVPVSIAHRFSDKHNIPLHIVDGSGHWVLTEDADKTAKLIHQFWNSEHNL